MTLGGGHAAQPNLKNFIINSTYANKQKEKNDDEWRVDGISEYLEKLHAFQLTSNIKSGGTIDPAKTPNWPTGWLWKM